LRSQQLPLWCVAPREAGRSFIVILGWPFLRSSLTPNPSQLKDRRHPKPTSPIRKNCYPTRSECPDTGFNCEVKDDRTDEGTPRGVLTRAPLISHSALSLCRSPCGSGHQPSCDCRNAYKDDEELEDQGVAAIWFEVVNGDKQNGGNNAEFGQSKGDQPSGPRIYV
jgi:hypothetical protein